MPEPILAGFLGDRTLGARRGNAGRLGREAWGGVLGTRGGRPIVRIELQGREIREAVRGRLNACHRRRGGNDRRG